MSPNNDQDAASVPEVHIVNLKVPPFSGKNVKLWFAQLEAQFTSHNIKSEKTKFAHIAGQLEPDIAERVADIIIAPPDPDTYTQLKNRLTQELEESEQEKLRNFLDKMPIGDRKPTVLLRQMKNYAGEKVTDEFLQELFLQRLPSHVRAILATVKGSNTQSLADTADKIMESIQSPSIAAISSAPPATNSTDLLIASLAKQVAALTTAVQSLTTNKFPQRGRSRNRSPSHNRSRENSENRDICWYHRKFKDNATKCTSPCKYTKQEN